MPRCPACDRQVCLDGLATAPFCSDRCRLIDLGRWLDETHALPTRGGGGEDEDEESAPRTAPAEDREDDGG